jgi:hypothetical protein
MYSLPVDMEQNYARQDVSYNFALNAHACDKIYIEDEETMMTRLEETLIPYPYHLFLC